MAKRTQTMTGAEIVALTERRLLVKARVLELRGKVEERIAAIFALLIGAGLFRYTGWWGLGLVVGYQVATGVKAYRNYRRVVPPKQLAA